MNLQYPTECHPVDVEGSTCQPLRSAVEDV